MAHGVFKNKWLPYLLVLPQVAVTLAFFVWPAMDSLKLSLYRVMPFTGELRYVGLRNFQLLLSSPEYHRSIATTLIFTVLVTVLSMSASLALAILVNQRIRGLRYYRAALLWPYGIAPPVAGIIWMSLFFPGYGLLSYLGSQYLGIDVNWLLDGRSALALLVGAAAWAHLGYNVAFFIAGLEQIPIDLLEAASVDGATPWKRFWTITFPLLSPVTFFLVTMNLTYALFETFGLVNAVTRGGPGDATSILVYKAYQDGMRNLNYSASAAQSVILMAAAIVLTALQFRFLERRISY